MLVCAVLQNYPYDTKNLKNSFSRERRITFQKVILNLQILPWLYVLLKKRIKMIKKINPMMEVSLHKQ